MTEFEIAGEFEKIHGKFKYRSSFPIVLAACQHMVDKTKLNKNPCYVHIHGNLDGKTEIEYKEINPSQ